MSSDIIIRVEGLGKKYTIRHEQRERYTALRDVIAGKAKGLFQKLKIRNSEKLKSGNNVSISASQRVRVSECEDVSASQRVSVSDFKDEEDFWALRDISFEVKRGEVVGIIGLPREIVTHQRSYPVRKSASFVSCANHAKFYFTGERKARAKALS